MATPTSISSFFFIERYEKDGILKLQPEDDYFPIDMGNDNYVAVKINDIDKGQATATEIIRVFENIFKLRDLADATTLFAIFDKTYARLNKRYHFHSERNQRISMRVVLFHMLGLKKKGNEINVKQFRRLNDYIEEKAHEENVNKATQSIVNILLSDSASTSLLEFYKEKRAKLIRFIEMQNALAEKVLLPMAEILRVALTEGLLFFIGLEAAVIIFRVFSGLLRLYRFLSGLRALAGLTWLLKKIETFFSVAYKLFKLYMVKEIVVDVFKTVQLFVKMLTDLLGGILDVFVFQDYAIENNILFFDGVEHFSTEDDEMLFETLNEYP